MRAYAIPRPMPAVCAQPGDEIRINGAWWVLTQARGDRGGGIRLTVTNHTGRCAITVPATRWCEVRVCVTVAAAPDGRDGDHGPAPDTVVGFRAGSPERAARLAAVAA